MQGQTRPCPPRAGGMNKNRQMKLHKDIKPELVCSKDETRHVLHHPYQMRRPLGILMPERIK